MPTREEGGRGGVFDPRSSEDQKIKNPYLGPMSIIFKDFNSLNDTFMPIRVNMRKQK